MHLHFSKFILKERGKKANVRLETFFCKLPLTKIKPSFKEMRQKFLKKVISPHVSQISVTTKSQSQSQPVKLKKIHFFLQLFIGIFISSQSSFSNLVSGHKKSIHISMGACKLKSLNYRKKIAKEEIENQRK